MAPIYPHHDIEKYKRHCALESAAYIKHFEPKKQSTTQIYNMLLLIITPLNKEKKEKKEKQALSNSSRPIRADLLLIGAIFKIQDRKLNY